MGRYKEGSRIQQVWSIFEKDGGKAAFEFGSTLNLKENTLKHWVGVWSRELGKPNEVATPKAPRQPRQPKANGEPQPVVRHFKQVLEVSYCPAPNNKVYLLEQGPQQSIVQFLHDGREQCIGNEWLGLPVEGERKYRRECSF
jgi:hypothetical protein